MGHAHSASCGAWVGEALVNTIKVRMPASAVTRAKLGNDIGPRLVSLLSLVRRLQAQ